MVPLFGKRHFSPRRHRRGFAPPLLVCGLSSAIRADSCTLHHRERAGIVFVFAAEAVYEQERGKTSQPHRRQEGPQRRPMVAGGCRGPRDAATTRSSAGCVGSNGMRLEVALLDLVIDLLRWPPRRMRWLQLPQMMRQHSSQRARRHSATVLRLESSSRRFVMAVQPLVSDAAVRRCSSRRRDRPGGHRGATRGRRLLRRAA